MARPTHIPQKRSAAKPARRQLVAATALALTFAVVAAACTSGDTPVPETTIATTTTTTTPERVTDSQLTIGLLLPTTDALLGEGLIQAATTAVERINETSGVAGRDIRLEIVDEGDSAGTAAAGIAQLIERDVDAIVGPSSSLIALSTLDDIVAAGIVACSPTASALALDNFPDEGLFFRTIPSDSLQAVAIADEAEGTGVRSIAVVFVDDAYGRPFSQSVEAALRDGSRSTNSVQSFGFGPDDSLDDLATEVAESGARVVVILAGSQDGTSFLGALGSTSFPSLTDVIVNDALRDPTSQQLIETLPTSFRAKIRGIAPQAQSTDERNPFDPPGLFAANAFDCVNLIALAADLVGPDDPSLFAKQIPALTTGGRRCTTYERCAELLTDGLDINYDGPDGITELLQVGYPARSRFDVFRFDETGRAFFSKPITVSSL